jgi:Nickel responsive protein SCO4226-like
MPRYLVTRALGPIGDEQLAAAVEHSGRIREERFPDVLWEHSHVVQGPGGLVAYCIYAAPDPSRVREYSAAAGLPANDVWEIHADIIPDGVG